MPFQTHTGIVRMAWDRQRKKHYFIMVEIRLSHDHCEGLKAARFPRLTPTLVTVPRTLFAFRIFTFST